MKITVVAKPNKKQVKVEQISSGYYIVSVKAPPKEGQANLAIRDALSDYFSVPKSEITLVSGHTTKVKTFQVPDILVNFEPPGTQEELF